MEMESKVREEAERMYPSTHTHDGVVMDYPLHKHQQAAYIAGATRDAWVKVEDKLPPSGELVLFLVNETDMYVGIYHHNKFEVWGSGRDPVTDMTVTRWQPLPDAPKREM